ncbi:MAG: transcription elongation factor GreA [Clostridiales bacterium]|nr:transcription elongation factor GreA [Clostridiales bacterium]
MSKEIIVTEEGLKNLQEELHYLKTVKRKEVVESIRVALGFGDLSENSEYDEAKNEQAKTEARIQELEETLKNVKLISDSDLHTESVNVGNKVKVFNEKYEEEVEYTIVGSTEANALKNYISDQSPIGRALMGAKTGQTVEVQTPKDIMKIKILDITK